MLEEAAPAFTPALRPLPAPSTMALLTWEKETLGIFVSGHPLADVAEALARTGATPIKDLRGDRGRFAGAHRGAGHGGAPHADQGAAADALRDGRGHDRHRSSASCFRNRIRNCKARSSKMRSSSSTAACVCASAAARSRAKRRRSSSACRSTRCSPSRGKRRRRSSPAGTSPCPRAATSTRLAQLLEESPGTIPLVFHISGQTKRSSRGIANAPYVKRELERIVGPR